MPSISPKRAPALLALADGTVFRGVSFGAETERVGEVVFNTAMTGYQEILTDPSYSQQLVTLTYPHIGNTGINEVDAESSAIHAAGLIVRSATEGSRQWRATRSLGDYLRGNGVPAIAEIDTRKLTRILREHGAQNGCLIAGAGASDEAAAIAKARAFPGLKGMDLARVVSRTQVESWTAGTWDLDRQAFRSVDTRFHVVAYDFGVKANILRLLADRGCRVTIVPAETPAEAVMALKPDGVFLSNGPGDPEPCDYAINAIKVFLARKLPVFGICLGHQLLGLAAGAKTLKMKFGHHGANHPVIDLDTSKVMISSQNHGFAVDDASLPSHVRATHRSLFDGSLQGIELTNAPAFSFQGHPEASPGPRDVEGLFDRFIQMLEGSRAAA